MASGNGTSSSPPPPPPPLAALIDGGTVVLLGDPAAVTREQLVEVIADFGGQLLDAEEVSEGDRAVDVLVIGGDALPLTESGELDVHLHALQARRVVSEQELLYELKVAGDAEGPSRLFTDTALASLLKLPLRRVRAWARAGLIRPTVVEHGVPRYDFRQAAAVRTLAALSEAGVGTAKLRRSLQQLRAWLPDAQRPLEQLAILERDGELLVRLEAGELAEPSGQQQIDFEHPEHLERPESEEPAGPFQLRLAGDDSSPRSAGDWHEQGIDQEQYGLLAEAEQSYRRALLDGGPDAQITFDLASVLGPVSQPQ